MSPLEDKLRELLVGKTISTVNVTQYEGHGVAAVYIVTTDGETIDFTARERNGGGHIAVYAGDDLVSP